MTTDIKELVKRLRDMLPQSVGPKAADALEALAGEVAKREACLCYKGGWIDRAKAAEAERDSLKVALGAIAVKAGTSECGGNYVAAVSLIGELEQMADAAIRAAGDGR